MANTLEQDIIGVWWLQSRVDTASDGSHRIDPTLGANPLGILTYAPGRFAAQFMKRDRTNNNSLRNNAQGENNTGAVGGYDAYFGTYEVDESSGSVLHRLEGALAPENVGIEVLRTLLVDNDQLEIKLDTTTAQGEPVSRTLTWQRIG